MITSRTGVGVLPKMTYTRRLRPKGVPFSGFRCVKGKGFHWHEGVGISLAEVYEGVGKSVILVFKWTKRTNRCILWLWKSRGNVVAFWFIPILKKAHLQQLKGDAKFYARYVRGVPFVNRRCMKGLPFLSQLGPVARSVVSVNQRLIPWQCIGFDTA